MDLFILDKLILSFLNSISSERLFTLSLLCMGITTVLCNNNSSRKVRK
ncbi:hypothetical protein G8S49_11365 [Clostridium botulinum C]|uniref:Uncharacterized protein n=1 Tax=Clostridium botulinum C TaxID=36828 RepID=A0A9Q3VBJ1_CLOBO|nr:hypothetical protein [Clostridium botulinum]MCD3195752.1 hypothetical protein [Clostridium botulinum C]MCD3201168.1 hypothetical protein [Clostridium botulinum C]MCD3206662.1 hypothetical protein [Clostridium botulinum C]MCD3209339.1 hypothetical protein [Clostridium botulinum C]MCD3226471.1 hypothetical protein [Clostridium botulinum C]